MNAEDWEMGHLYMARTFHATTPSPPLARWPLSWSYQALKFTDWFYAKHTGMDTVVYVRFLRACTWWLLLQTLTTAPILLAIHFNFSKGIPLTDMSRASLSWLVTTPKDPKQCQSNAATCEREPNPQGRKLLWIHLCLLWWISCTWCYALWWIGRGSLQIRRRLIDDLRKRKAEEKEKSVAEASSRNQHFQEDTQHPPQLRSEVDQTHEPSVFKNVAEAQGLTPPADDGEGWRQRTLMVMNLPVTMRDEASVRRYFEEFLRPDDGSILSIEDQLERTSENRREANTSEASDAPLNGEPVEGEGTTRGIPQSASDFYASRNMRSPVQTVVLVRKMNELSSMLQRRQDILSQLEAAHIKLAQNAMQAVGKTTQKIRKDRRRDEKNRRKAPVDAKNDPSPDARGGDGQDDGPPALVADIEKQAVGEGRTEQQRAVELAHRLASFSPANKGMHTRVRDMAGLQIEAGEGAREEKDGMPETVWEALADVPRELLDPYQPLTRLSALFRGQTVPTIDYLLTKLNLLTALVTEMRARPPTSYEPTSTAFVTFRDPRQARMVWRELKTQIVIKVRMAPEVKDLDWERLMRTSFTGDLVRGLGVNAFFWGFTIFWVIPINLLTTGLFSVQNIELVVPGLRQFFDANPHFKGFVTVTLPTVIVSLITMAVPELIFQISKRAQGFVTFSTLYDQCLCRYWKFIICNVVIFFCIGVTAVQTILQQVDKTSQVLDTIAFSFPTAAPFFVSYLILGMALHTGFELLGFMVPLIQHLGARKAPTPRVRALKTLPRNFNRYYWLPFHILIMTIVFIFGVLNPLVIPFALIYIFVAMIVFKKNFAFTYFRRFNEMQGEIYYARLLRFSLDGLTTAQAVIVIFFSVTKQEAVYIGMTAVLIPLTVALKLLATRLWKSQCRAVEDDEANALCGIGENTPLTQSGQRDWTDVELRGSQDAASRMPLDARASGRFPAVHEAPATGSALFRYWARIHDSFNANGRDRPSYIASMHAKGERLDKPVLSGAKLVAKAPKHAFKSAADAARHRGQSAKAQIEYARQKPGSELDLAERADPAQILAEQGQAARQQRRKNNVSGASLRRGRSHRSALSDEAPFLSGIDAVNNHAPVVMDDEEQDFEDGEPELEPYRTTPHRGRSQRRRPSGSYSTSIIKANPAPGVFTDSPSGRGEFGALHAKTSSSSGGNDFAPAVNEKAGVGRFQRMLTALGDSGFTSDGTGQAQKADELSDDEEGEADDGALVRPHGKLRWDDTPNNLARYNNPFYSRELDPFLWLPRDPLAPVDLFDTIEWYGAALVSSQGGPGHVGEWDEDEEEDDLPLLDKDGAVISPSGYGDVGVAELHGDEEIFVTGTLAHRLQEAEDAEVVVDVAASLPRNVMDEYQRAIRRGTASEIDGGDDSASQRSGSPLTGRRASMALSGVSIPIRSPSLRARQAQHLDAHYEGQDPARLSPNIQRKVTGNTIPPLDLEPPAIPSPTAIGKMPTTSSPLDIQDDAQQQKQAAAEGAGVAHPTVSFDPTAAAPSHARHGTLGLGAAEGARHGTHPRRASMRSGADSVLSAGSRTVTMRQALRAEILEEERRRVLGEKLLARKKRTSKRKGTADTARHEEANDAEDAMERMADDSSHLPSDTIMGRHERAVRRQQAMSESGEGGVGMSLSPSERRNMSLSQGSARPDRSPSLAPRFALRDFSFSRDKSPQAQRSGSILSRDSPARQASVSRGGATLTAGRSTGGLPVRRPTSSQSAAAAGAAAQAVPMQQLGPGRLALVTAPAATLGAELNNNERYGQLSASPVESLPRGGSVPVTPDVPSIEVRSPHSSEPPA
ncbi:hypothetical protein IE81DRAFT_320078 [Ceraceosorus guamensis]|uniref:DUF221-domain-containing protein n=1 Tax=Ceraceosorus guamensis TaxID=1522189 RepID=A0A316W640_9BASI|nr:hypothetical protein IE81DRAFT_320078 [Ceraceosorus guamensis]PWN45347.1 hypothetical protein IE81DRAFT_320078 [Ceraceosorus guamensis]